MSDITYHYDDRVVESYFQHTKVELCKIASRSNWPVWHYDGRWECSMPADHLDYDLPHLAFKLHNPEAGLAWIGPWIDSPEDKDA